MKKILFVFLPFIAEFSQLISMEKPARYTSVTNIKEPYFNSAKQLYVIEAEYADAKDAGYINYKPEFHSMDRNNWKLVSIFVKDNLRRKKIATKLFKALHDAVKNQGGTHITWQVSPSAIYMTKDQLVSYYYSMIKNVDAALLQKVEVREVGPYGFEMMHMTVKIGDMLPESEL